MKSIKLFITMALVFLAANDNGAAHTSTESNASSEKNVHYSKRTMDITTENILKITLEGEINLERGKNNKLLVKTECRKKGFVWGMSNNKSRGEYEVRLERKEPMIFVRPVKRDNLYSMGVNVYRELIKNDLFVPEVSQIDIQTKRGYITCNAPFSNLKIQNEKGKTEIYIKKENLRSLNCITGDGRIIMNGVKTGDKFLMLNGDGDSEYTIHSESGDIIVNLY